ncbi:PaaI family thioesterase [Streptomyces sp. NPDC050560]|uniref:PaaI family thioesterase n=1 Tax=Streptomyces sp. NPDC050560 TaxID=3365630 RepID=UPI0037BB9968
MPEPVDLHRLTAALGDGELVETGADFARSIPEDCLIARLGIALARVGRGRAEATMTVARHHLNQRGVAQAGAVVALADAAAGWASYSAVPHGGFTTLDLTTHLLRPAREGDLLTATATPVRLGRTVQVIDVLVTRTGDTGGAAPPAVARFTCSQLVREAVRR